MGEYFRTNSISSDSRILEWSRDGEEGDEGDVGRRYAVQLVSSDVDEPSSPSPSSPPRDEH